MEIRRKRKERRINPEDFKLKFSTFLIIIKLKMANIIAIHIGEAFTKRI